jgi:hypothetical protein
VCLEKGYYPPKIELLNKENDAYSVDGTGYPIFKQSHVSTNNTNSITHQSDRFSNDISLLSANK